MREKGRKAQKGREKERRVGGGGVEDEEGDKKGKSGGKKIGESGKESGQRK